MRTDPSGSKLTQLNREPRIVVGIIYPTGSIYVTNKRAAIANVPGNVVHGCLEDISSVSRRIDPLEGRSTIGSFSFTVTDVDGELTDEMRAQLNAGEGVGRREVRLYTGDTDDFTDGTWSRIDTYVVDSTVALDRGSYRFTCADRQRQLRERIFPRVTTRLVADFSSTETTSIEVSSTDGFELVPHTASFSDAPSASVFYFRLKKTGEIVRATGVAASPARFTGLTRERFNTIAQAIDVDPAADLDRQPEIELVYYLEMPVPQLVYALMTGVILDTGGSELPEGYHVGVDEAFLEADTFRNVGTDLYDPNDLEAGLVLFFSSGRGLKETDGKRFIEEQLLFPMWSYLHLTSEGTFVLRRLAPLLAGASASAIAFADNIVSHGALEHQVGQVANRVIIHWNHDGDDFTRHTEFNNLSSISAHGIGRTLEFELLGMVVARHTRATLNRIFDSMTDRYGAPPIGLDLELMPTMNQVETGDILRVVLGEMRDFTALAHLDRSFEIEARDWNPRTGDVRVQLLGSTARTEPDQPPTAAAPPLDDAWYSSEGVALNTVLTMSGNNITANGNLAGNADLRAGVYYHLGDLVLNAGVTVTLNNNVQLRVRGAVTVNGEFDGVGRGAAAIADPNTIGPPYVPHPGAELVQTVGSTRGSDGLRSENRGSVIAVWLMALTGPQRIGLAAMPRPALDVAAGSLLGMPAELMGTPGVYGAPFVSHDPESVQALGGAGGASGAGLAIVCRDSLSFGASGRIDLSGDDGAVGNAVNFGPDLVTGAGGGGAPGNLLVVLDGNDIPLPDLSAHFFANHGATPQTGSPVNDQFWLLQFPTQPWTGEGPGIGAADLWQSSHVVMWAPQLGEVGDSDDEVTPAPTALAATVDSVGVNWSWDPGPADGSDYTELWVATTNDRTGAVLVSRRKSSSAFVASSTSVTRYGWVRNFKSGVGYSAWHPVSSTGGVSATYGGAAGPQGDPGEDAVTVGVSPQFGGWTQAPNGGAFDPTGTTCDITFTFYRAGASIATHVIRVTRSGATLTAATFSESGEATAETIVGGGTSVLTALVQHTASGVTGGEAITVVVGGDDGAPGAQGDPGADGDDGLSVHTVAVYRRASSAPATPTGGSYNFGTQTLTPPSSWFASPPASDGTPLWSSVATFEVQGITGIDSSTTWSSPALMVADGDPGGMGWPVDASGLPAGLRGVENSTTRAALSFDTAGRPSIDGSGSNAYGLPAIAVDPGETYTLTIRHRSSGASATGLYLRMNEKSSALSSGKTHLGNTPFESVTEARTSLVDLVANGAMPGTTVVESAYSYTPTAGARFASLSFYNWGTTGVAYAIESVRLTRAGSNVNVLTVGAPTVDLATQILGVLTAAFAAATLINANISVNADGSLTGAGGGAPTISSLSGSVATGQLTANVLAALQAVIGNLSAIHANLGTITAGTITLNSSGHIKSGATAYDGDGGWWLGFDGGEAALSLRDGTDYLRLKPSIGIETNLIETRRSLTDWGPTQTFTPTWGAGFSTDPTGDLNYAVSVDGLWATMWTTVDRTGTADTAAMSITNLPSAIRPSGSLFRWSMGVGTGVHGSNEVQVGAKIWEASHASAGTVEFGTLSHTADSSPNIFQLNQWPTSGTKGLRRGFRLTWAL